MIDIRQGQASEPDLPEGRCQACLGELQEIHEIHLSGLGVQINASSVGKHPGSGLEGRITRHDALVTLMFINEGFTFNSTLFPSVE
jgi:hypothetical protein